MSPPADGSVQTFPASDGYVWHYRAYPAAGVVRGHVVYLHGIQSHGGWYTASARHLAGAGFAVSLLDRRGSGLNDAARGDTPSYRRLLDDIAEFVQRLRSDSLTVSPGGSKAPPPVFL